MGILGGIGILSTRYPCRRIAPGYVGVSPALLGAAGGRSAPHATGAILGSVYRPQSNMQALADRFLVGYPYDGEWHTPNVQVVSVYVDQLERQADAAPSPYQLAMTGTKVAPASAAKGIAGGLGRDRSVKTQPAPEKPEPSEKPDAKSDLSRARAKQFGFRLCSNIPEALRCGGPHRRRRRAGDRRAG
jgi:hypothetical protein